MQNSRGELDFERAGAQPMLSKYVFGDIDFICVLREHCTELGTKELQTLNERAEVYNAGK